MAPRVAQRPDLASVLALLMAALMLPLAASSQQAIIPFQFSLSDPGARSMGFGGAFVALADDATAAFANPAGLTQLVKPEISIETRRWDYVSSYTRSGNTDGSPTGSGIDTLSGLQRATSEYDTTGISFLSVAWPGDKLSFALYRHVYGNLGFYGETQGLFSGEANCCRSRWGDQQMRSRLDFVNYGFSSAYRVGESLDLGIGLVYNDVSIAATTSEYLWDADTPEAFFEPNSYLPSRLILTENLSVQGHDWTITAGFLWRMSERWRLGGVFRDGSKSKLHNRVIAGEAIDLGVPPGDVIGEVWAMAVGFPDIYGLGLAYRNADDNLTLSLQWDRIEYSDMPSSIPLDDQTIDDGDEVHIGAEYVFLDSTPIVALRVGIWHDPDHQMYATVDEPFTQAMLPGGKDSTHFTAGIGIALQRFQIDFAFDFSDQVDVFSLSAIYSF
jgi:long-subunit fatty acid transport protein